MKPFIKPQSSCTWYNYKVREIQTIPSTLSKHKRRIERERKKHAKKAYRKYLKAQLNIELIENKDTDD